MEDGPNLNRRGFFTATGGISIAALLAACGGSDSGSDDTGAASTPAAAPAGSTDAAPAAAAAPKFDPTTETGPIKTFEWAGYEVPEMWEGYVKGEFNADSPMKFTFLENDQQALAKVASGVEYDLIHPCIAYWPDYKAAGLIQAFDPSLLPRLRGHPRGDPHARRRHRRPDLPRAVRHRLLDAHLPRRQDQSGRAVVERPARRPVQGPHGAVLRRGLDHQDRPPHQRRRARRPERRSPPRRSRPRPRP